MASRSRTRAPSKAKGARRARRASGAAKGDGEEPGSRTKDIWKGSISFGLVEIPVALVAAERSHEIKLTYLDRRDFSPVGYKRYNKSNDAEVPWEEIVRGYEYQKGEYVVLTPQDLERASPELTRAIDIVHFVDADAIEPIYYDRTYYLEPLRPRSKGYVLLREVLRRTKKVGVAKVAIRAREHVAAVGVRGTALVLYLLRFANEVKSPADLDRADGDLADARVQAREIEIAERLVDDMTGEWDPKEFTNEYAEDLMKLVESRVASGKTHVLDESEPERAPRKGAEAPDLMPLLQRSLEARRPRVGRPRSRARSRSTAARSRRGR